MRTVAKIFFLVVALIAFACKPHDGHEANATHYTCPMHPNVVQDEPGHCPVCGMDLVKQGTTGKSDAGIMLTESQVRLANITTTLVRPELIGNQVILNGRIAIDEEKTEVISARVPGRIERLYVKEVGTPIRKGQVLYDVYSEQLLTLQQEYLLALQTRESSTSPRYEAFVKAGEKKLELYGMTRSQISQLTTTRKTNPTIAFATNVAGFVVEVVVTEGQYVGEGDPLYRIENTDDVWAEVQLYPGEVSFMQVGMWVNVVVDGDENNSAKGQVTFISPEYADGGQVTTARVVLNNRDQKYLPGMLATIILNHREKKAIAIPTDAVIRDGNGSHVWILDKEGAFRPRMVTTGIENSEKVEIAEGVAEGENVVITGAYLLYSEMVLKRGGELVSHNHEMK